MDLFGEVTIMSKGKVKASKICSKCGRVLPLWMYSNDKAGKDGKRTTCKDCDRDTQKKSREKRSYYIEIEYKQCSDCGRIKPIGEFGKDKTKTDGHRSYCLECLRLRSGRTKENERRGLRRDGGEAHFKSKNNH